MSKNLIDLFAPEEGYSFEKGLGCTYSVSDDTINHICRALKIDTNKEKYEAFFTGGDEGTFKLFVQQGELFGKSMPNFVVPINPEKGCLHAKVYLLKFTPFTPNNIDEGENKNKRLTYRVIVTSANLTNADEHNVYVRFDFDSDEGGCGLEDVFDNSSSPECFLKQLSICLNDKLSPNGENQNKQFYIVDQKTLKARSDIKSKTCLIVSPFLTKCTVSACFENAESRKILISRKDELDKLGKIEGVEYYVLNDSVEQNKEDNDKRLPSALHTKMYVFINEEQRKKNLPKATIFLGSANATISAFNGNIETLVKFEDDFDLDDFMKGFLLYEPTQDKPKEEKLKEFEDVCRKILQGFDYTDEYYKISIPEDLKGLSKKCEIQLGGSEKKCENNELTWKRENKCKHLVELEIKIGDDKDSIRYTKKYTLMVDGGSIQIQAETIVNQNILNRLAKAIKSGTSSKKQKDGDGNTKSNKIASVDGVMDLICQIKTKKNAEDMSQALEELIGAGNKDPFTDAKKEIDKIWEIKNGNNRK